MRIKNFVIATRGYEAEGATPRCALGLDYRLGIELILIFLEINQYSRRPLPLHLAAGMPRLGKNKVTGLSWPRPCTGPIKLPMIVCCVCACPLPVHNRGKEGGMGGGHGSKVDRSDG